MLFGAVYTTIATSFVVATLLAHDAGGGPLLETSLRVLGTVLLFGIPLGIACGAIATWGYSHWHQRTLLGPRFAALGAAVAGTAALAFSSLLPSGLRPSTSFVFLFTIIGMIGGLLFLRFAIPKSPIPLRRTMLAVFVLASALMFSQVAMWVSWLHGAYLLSVSNDAPSDTLVATIHKVPVNRDPVHMYFPGHGFYCYRIAVFLEPRGGPPISTSCLILDSVEPDEDKINAHWIDRDTLRANIDVHHSVEVVANLYGASSWRNVGP